MTRPVLAILLALCACAGCGAVAVPAPPRPDAWCGSAEPPGHDPAGEPEAVDDQRLAAQLLRAGESLIDARKTVPLDTLIAQLDRAQCRLTLAPPPAGRLSAAQLYERARESTLVLGRLYKCPKCKKRHMVTAAGFVISESGAVATNCHVVNEAGSLALVAMTADGRVLPVTEVLAASRADDVVILRVEGAGLKPLPISADAPVGAPVRVLSHPRGRLYTLTEGIVSRYFTHRRNGKDVAMMAITADYARGSSGAPVLDEQGAVVGLAASTASIYYEKDADGRDLNLQMVVKQCVPARSLLALIAP